MGPIAIFFSGGGGLGILSALMGSTSTILYRKAITAWPYGSNSFMLLGNWIGTAISILLLFFGEKYWKSDADWIVILVFLILSFSMYHNGNQMMHLNRNEKLSTLQIFGNIATILTIISGFFLYGKTSLATLGIAVLCGGILFWTQFFDGGGFHPPKNWRPIVITYFLGGIQSLVMVWVIGEMGSAGYFILSSFFATGIAIFATINKGALGEIILGTRTFYLYRTADGVMFNTVRYLHFFLIGSLGPVVTTLLGMLSNITTLIFGRLWLGEKNSVKEWAINIILCMLVGLGFYLK